MECKSFYVDRLDNRNSDRQRNNERDGVGWGEGLGSRSVSVCVYKCVCVPVIVAWGCSRQLTWHCWGHPRESNCQPQPEATASKTTASKTKLLDALTSFTQAILRRRDGLTKPSEVRKKKRQFVSGSPFYFATPKTNYHRVQCVQGRGTWF